MKVKVILEHCEGHNIERDFNDAIEYIQDNWLIIKHEEGYNKYPLFKVQGIEVTEDAV